MVFTTLLSSLIPRSMFSLSPELIGALVDGRIECVGDAVDEGHYHANDVTHGPLVPPSLPLELLGAAIPLHHHHIPGVVGEPEIIGSAGTSCRIPVDSSPEHFKMAPMRFRYDGEGGQLPPSKRDGLRLNHNGSSHR